jgi:carbohydrate kinase (thermoresistant glucokinase family)
MSQQVLIMGVSGCGKTTVGKMLADELNAVFYDADDFHPAANRDKMARGIPLDEEDRKPWLQSIAETIRAQNQTFVLACSALRESYRQQLLAACPGMKIIHLHGSRELLLERMQQRQGHFMPASLLDSQLATLEPPAAALRLDIAHTSQEIVSASHAFLSFSIKAK